MAYYPDLSPYRYGLEATPWPANGPIDEEHQPFRWIWDVGGPEPSFERPEVNVGWLDASQPFPTGSIAPHIIQRLTEIVDQSTYHLTRGKHACPFCGYWSEGRVGAAEIRVPGDDSVFAAPNLVAHYVVAHRYRPPAGFIDALAKEDVQLTIVPGSRRPIPAEQLRRESVDSSDLSGQIARLLVEYGLEGQIRLVRLEVGSALNVEAVLSPQATDIQRRVVRHVSGRSLVSPSQVAHGVLTMLGAQLELIKEELMGARGAPRRE